MVALQVFVYSSFIWSWSSSSTIANSIWIRFFRFPFNIFITRSCSCITSTSITSTTFKYSFLFLFYIFYLYILTFILNNFLCLRNIWAFYKLNWRFAFTIWLRMFDTSKWSSNMVLDKLRTVSWERISD